MEYGKRKICDEIKRVAGQIKSGKKKKKISKIQQSTILLGGEFDKSEAYHVTFNAKQTVVC